MKRLVSIAGILLLAAGAVLTHVVRHRILHVEASPELVAQLRRRLAAMPRELGSGEYAPAEYEINSAVVERSGADAYVARGYKDSEGRNYRVYIGGAIRNRESFHAPNYCMPAAGWEILSQSSVASPMVEAGNRISRLDLRKGNARMLVYYWFQCGRRQTDHDLVARWYRFLDFVSAALDLFAHTPVQPTMISQIYVPYEGDADSADERARRFMDAVRPALLQAVDPQEN